MALGAGPGDVLRLVLGYGVRLAGIGLAIGIPVAAAASRLLGSLLYGVSPTDPLVFGAVSVTVMAVATAACYMPDEAGNATGSASGSPKRVGAGG